MRTIKGVVVANAICVTATGVVISEPCLLADIYLTVASNGDWIKLYDGHDSGGRYLGEYAASQLQTRQFNSAFPWFLPRGLYVEFEQTDSVAVFAVIPITEKDLE